MPQYVYKCPQAHYKEVLHRMAYSTGIVCECGEMMHRVPQMPAVVWGGLPPHKEHYRGRAAREFLDGFDERKDQYIAKKEARGNT